jgi:hypothetical protein
MESTHAGPAKIAEVEKGKGQKNRRAEEQKAEKHGHGLEARILLRSSAVLLFCPSGLWTWEFRDPLPQWYVSCSVFADYDAQTLISPSPIRFLQEHPP